MPPTRRLTGHLLPLVVVMVVGAALWYLHAIAWDLGGRSPILSYDSAQYALAAREFAWRARLATPYALPIDLATHAHPLWPLSTLQPGLVLLEAAIFKVGTLLGARVGSDPRAWLTLIPVFVSYLMLGAGAVLGTRHLLIRYVPDASRTVRALGPLTLGLMVLLDPEAQHFAVTGLTELPFTVLLLAALLGLARGAGAEYPFVFGLLLGLGGLFRANMLWLAPCFALASAWTAPRERRLRVLALVLAGYVLPLAPWWLYKWRAFGSPAWDLTRFAIWDQVDGRSWLQLYHRAELPELPTAAAGAPLLAAKLGANLARLVPALLEGPRGLWLGALVAWLFTRPRPALAAAGAVALVGLVLNLFAACLSIPWLRYVFPTRVLAEAAGFLALWALLQRIPGVTPRLRVALGAIAVTLALAWGAWLTVLAQGEARMTSRERGVPSSFTLTALSVELNGALKPGEVLMSNLGPALAWQTNHPVIHLAYAPADVPACRRRHEFRHILLVFRDAERAWPLWQETVERAGFAATVEGLHAVHERRYDSADGFHVVWLELGPLEPTLAAAPRCARAGSGSPPGPGRDEPDVERPGAADRGARAGPSEKEVRHDPQDPASLARDPRVRGPLRLHDRTPHGPEPRPVAHPA